jgi:hypothetical protein
MNDATSLPGTTGERREARRLRPANHTGELLLRDGRTQVAVPVVALQDCSPSGARVLMRQAYEPGHLVSLVLSSQGIPMEHMGTVAWCKAASVAELDRISMPHGSLLFMVGLQMRGPVSLAASLMALP